MNSYLARREGTDPKKVGRAAEKLTAKVIGARLTPASGAASVKGDFSTEAFLFEHKATQAASLVLQLDWLCKIQGEADDVVRKPALVVAFTDHTGRPHRHGRWVIMPERVFEELCEAAGSP